MKKLEITLTKRVSDRYVFMIEIIQNVRMTHTSNSEIRHQTLVVPKRSI